MSFFDTCVKLATYLACVGLGLELSHRLYRRTTARILEMDASAIWLSFLSSLAACIPLATALAVSMAFVTFLDKGSLLTLGLSYTGDSLLFVAYGAAIGFCCVTLMFLIAMVSGYVNVRPSKLSDDCMTCLPLFFGGLADFFTAAVFEEIIIRGYVFYVMLQSLGPLPAIIGSSVIFSLAHMVRHKETPVMFAVNTFLFGLLTATIRYYTGTLWLPIGLHFGWNVASGPVFGLPCSGRSYDHGMVESEVTGPLWLMGGRYSPDAGALGTVALIVAAAGLVSVTPIG